MTWSRPRLQLISRLYDARPSQCLTCGRRFYATAEGKAEKARHLDWHYRTKQRLIATAQRGQSRSWYIDELVSPRPAAAPESMMLTVMQEWIRFRGDEDDAEGARSGPKASEGTNADAPERNDPKQKFVRVPSDKALAQLPCPICQDKFETSWKEELQDFVWMDAVKIGGRIFHASCHADYQKDGGNTPGRTSTPDSVLGKRKLEVRDRHSGAHEEACEGADTGCYRKAITMNPPQRRFAKAPSDRVLTKAFRANFLVPGD